MRSIIHLEAPFVNEHPRHFEKTYNAAHPADALSRGVGICTGSDEGL